MRPQNKGGDDIFLISTHKELVQKLKELEQRVGEHDKTIFEIFDAIRKLMQPPEKTSRRIGSIVDD